MIANCLPVIFPHLELHCKDKEEGVRTMVAECMGSLTCLQPETMLAKLQELIKAHGTINAPNRVVAPDDATSAENALVCWTVATCIKLAIAGKVDPNQLTVYMSD